MDIVIIGTGNVATVLGRKILSAGHRILQVVGRDHQAANSLAILLNAEALNFDGDLSESADIVIIAVNDNSIEAVAKELELKNRFVVHTAGSVSKNILKRVTENYGVFYPLQSLRKEEIELPVIPILYDGGNDIVVKKLRSLALSISPLHALQADDDTRLKLHVAAVFVNNFSNHLYALAEDYSNKESINFKQLIPLITETANRVNRHSPKDVQTGPAERDDWDTIEKHLALLEKFPQMKNLYSILTESIMRSRK